MAVDVTFTNGIIAARERYFLKDKLLRMCESGENEAFRILTESGFGGGEAASVYEYEKLVAADERAIDDFVREYAPTKAEAEYLLCPRDFHNAKAVLKAEYLNADTAGMLAPDGLVTVETLKNCFKTDDFSPLCSELEQAIIQAREYLKQDDVSGARIGEIFERAKFLRLKNVCAKNRTLKKLIEAKADMTNILTCLRSSNENQAKEGLVAGGKLADKQLLKLFSDDEHAKSAFENTPYFGFVKLCLDEKARRVPMTAAENICDSFETDYLAENRYELKAAQPFLYYVFRRRAENANVRVIFACLLSGMGENQIKSRLRGAKGGIL